MALEASLTLAQGRPSPALVSWRALNFVGRPYFRHVLVNVEFGREVYLHGLSVVHSGEAEPSAPEHPGGNALRLRDGHRRLH